MPRVPRGRSPVKTFPGGRSPVLTFMRRWARLAGLLLPAILCLAVVGCACSAQDRPDPVVLSTPPAWTPSPPVALPATPPETPIELVTLTAENPGKGARRTLVAMGVPLPLGLGLTSIEGLTLKDGDGRWVPVQVTPRMRWGGVPIDAADAPLRWVDLRFFAELPAGGDATWTLCYGGLRPRPPQPVRIDGADGQLAIDTGPARFRLRRGGPDLFDEVVLNGRPVVAAGNGIYLTARGGRRFKTIWRGDGLEVESRGPLEAVVTLRGTHLPVDGGEDWLEFVLRMRFRADEPGVVLEHTLRNPNPAAHPGNVWTLGSPGSAWIEAASLELPVPGSSHLYALTPEGKRPLQGRGRISLLQASSGKSTWKSVRHADASGEVRLPFRGYRITGPELSGEIEGRQARPALSLVGENGGVTAALEEFWQNFPKGLEARDGRLELHLFPPGTPGTHEIQGGEQKTHRMQVWLEPPGSPAPEARLAAMEPVWPTLPPSWWLESRASFHPDAPRGKLRQGGIEATLETSIRPLGRNQRSFVTLADGLDAYGWREYGDVQADHETECRRPAGSDFISHYNNQYDYVLGAFHQFGRTGDRAYLEFALRTAAHTADIDVYHTRGDKPVYNGGMFWHTTHDTPAGTSAHRSFPALKLSRKCTSYTSGGPGLGHVYLEGLVTGWALTGDKRLLEAAVELGDFALTRRSLDRRESDGRALGNYLRSLVTLCEATGIRRFCEGADAIVPTLADEVMVGAVGWEKAMLGKALGRWLELDDARLILARRGGARAGDGTVSGGGSIEVVPAALGTAGQVAAGPGATSAEGAAPVPREGATGGTAPARAPRGIEEARRRRDAIEALMALSERVLSTEMPLDVNRARFADVLAYASIYGASHARASRWRSKAIDLLESLESGYWAKGTYPNAKELSVLLTNGGVARVLRTETRGASLLRP